MILLKFCLRLLEIIASLVLFSLLSGTYTLRKRKKVDFNLLAEGNLSDNDFIPDPPRLPAVGPDGLTGRRTAGLSAESAAKRAARVRKKKPFDKAHFMNYNRRLLRLRKGVCVLLETLFPEMVYPRRFNPETHSVDYLVDYIHRVVEDRELMPSRISRCYGDIDWDLTVLVCSAPKDCLRRLRRKLMKLLKAILPGLKVNKYFDHSSASVDALIEEITFVNEEQCQSGLVASSQDEQDTKPAAAAAAVPAPAPGDVHGATGTTSAARPKSATVTRGDPAAGGDHAPSSSTQQKHSRSNGADAHGKRTSSKSSSSSNTKASAAAHSRSTQVAEGESGTGPPTKKPRRESSSNPSPHPAPSSKSSSKESTQSTS